jgi:hypothetical protein
LAKGFDGTRQMQMGLGLRALALMVLIGAGLAAGARAAPDSDQKWFQQRTQALFDALTNGDKSIWDQTLDSDCIITTEDGDVEGRDKFLTDLKPLPKGFAGHISIRDLTVKGFGNTAVVHYWMDEWETIFGQKLRTTYVETDAYHQTNQEWKLVAMQTTVVPRDLEPVTADQRDWPAMVGEYHFPGDEKIRYRVFVRGSQLFGGRDENSATLLIPLAPLVFHQKGSIHLMVFVKNSSGAVTDVLELHKYNEVRMEHVSKTH